MTSNADETVIILYHYSYSPYAKRIAWYLALRGIPYFECLQPPMLPRPDLALLGIKHRRIPILAINRDVYLDTRLIIRKLESLFPEIPRLGASSSSIESVALERLLSMFTTETGLFEAAVNLLPTTLPLLNSKEYFQDRQDFLAGKPQGKNDSAKQRNNAPGETSAGNGGLSRESMQRARPESEARVARALDFLEHGLLADGRKWILEASPRGTVGTDGARPSLADLEAVWPFAWLTYLPSALPAERFNEKLYPRVFAWINRFRKAISATRDETQSPRKLSGEEAARRIMSAKREDIQQTVDLVDSIVADGNFNVGDRIVIWPTDTGSAHRDTGVLVAMDMHQVVLDVEGELGTIRLHAPRHGFRVRKVTPGSQPQVKEKL